MFHVRNIYIFTHIMSKTEQILLSCYIKFFFKYRNTSCPGLTHPTYIWKEEACSGFEAQSGKCHKNLSNPLLQLTPFLYTSLGHLLLSQLKVQPHEIINVCIFSNSVLILKLNFRIYIKIHIYKNIWLNFFFTLSSLMYSYFRRFSYANTTEMVFFNF